MKRLLVLYRELAGYFVNSMNHLADECNFEIDIVAYPVKSDAPFRFEFSKNIHLHSRTNLSAADLMLLSKSKSYDLIFCGGWSDKDYLSVVKANGNVASLIGFDKQWLGTWRDVLGVIYLRLKVRSLFDFAFVPGREQAQFAKYMGFKENRIFTGAYTCESHRFAKIYQKRKNKGLSHNLIYAGRYAPEKQVTLLWDVFNELSEEFPNWKLHCIGTGSLSNQAPQHSQIFHHGFLQGVELDNIMIDGDVFILPSSYEPWGVVVNEFALAGYPLILSNRVGARTALLTPQSGWEFDYRSKEDMKEKMRMAMQTSEHELRRMGEHAHQMSCMLDEKQYAASLLKMIESA
ncbi:MAG: glycosyltransferase family 4 protein [Flavobacteriales bacterium]|jgi:glycosyltransferase involved in cell wall biosynthesis